MPAARPRDIWLTGMDAREPGSRPTSSPRTGTSEPPGTPGPVRSSCIARFRSALSTAATADVTNAGSRAGDGVAQRNIHRSGTSIPQPVAGPTDSSGSPSHPDRPEPSPSRSARPTLASPQARAARVEPGSVGVNVGDSSAGGLHGQFTVRLTVRQSGRPGHGRASRPWPGPEPVPILAICSRFAGRLPGLP